MTEDLIGIASTLKTHRNDCEQFIRSFVNGNPAEPANAATTRLLQRLQDRCGQAVANIVLTTAQLQSKARSKLSLNDVPDTVWWVTEKALQQATPWQVAKLKADWMGQEPVHDLCCGIGGDSLQLAKRGNLTAVDLDPLHAAMADFNLDHVTSKDSRIEVVCGDVTNRPLGKLAAFHLDPDRRPNQQRCSNPRDYQPNWEQICLMVSPSAAAIIKLAPVSSIPADGLAMPEIHRCWISLSGSVREQALLWGSAIDRAGRVRGERSAIAMRFDGSFVGYAPVGTLVHQRAPATADRPAVLVDPNPAIRAAGLTEAFAVEHKLALISGPSGFLASNDEAIVGNGLVKALAFLGRVKWWGTCDDRKLRKEFRSRGVFPQTIKVRGTQHDPSHLVKRYRKCGEEPVTLWIGRQGKRVFAAITD